MVRYEIGIVETRNVIKTLLETFDYDFSDYALTSFKRRLEDIIINNGLKDADGLIYRLKNNKDYFEYFLREITPETTEMFRDPSLWRTLRDDIIPDITRTSGKLKFWVGNFDSGEDLYSLCITLNELGILNESTIYCSIISNVIEHKIKSGKIDFKQVETNEANYTRCNGDKNYSDYVTVNNGMATIDTKLIENVTFLKQNTLFNNCPNSVKLLLFRNQIIYYNQSLQDKIINNISNSLVAGGYLAIGAKETLDNTNTSNKFTVINDAEKVYKKKTG
ncbi:MAG TPA: CheR family methyltransferase [Tenuifilaceae bacterium]|nr:CheR family methyltransferase [Tenuifilaceae bacterium]HPE18130.1 CheR family methyltransferase [Tenuifilaceae bacterium]HPJ45711.1 CheR family methyltransferase [Tenuifilaceae bacterium]HPQ34277.1 CheR family methyltransferase [Tenuifilaceae bacterium]HRX67767.1 CheR family methyltransferase [Tenuifilaceae bacterium]